MPIDSAFWTKLAVKHGVTEEQAKAIASNEGLLGELNEMALRRDDAKQLTEQARDARTKADKEMAEAKSAWEQNTAWYGQKQADLILLDKYREIYGDLNDGNGNGNGHRPDPAPGLTADEISKRIQGGQHQIYSLTSQILDATEDYRERFGKRFPRKELEALALKPENAGRDFKDIYHDWVTPQIEAKQTEDVELRIKTAREEGEKAGLAKGRMREPTQGGPDELGPLWTPRPKKEEALDDVTLQRHFVETHDKVMERERASAGST